MIAHGLLGLACLIVSVSAVAQVEEAFNSYPLYGGAGAAGPATVDSAFINPAQAGLVPYSSVQASWGFKSEEFSVRYPGFPARTKEDSGVDPDFPIPNFVYKPTRRIGVSGIVIPFPLEQDIDAPDLPIVIFNQENTVNLQGTGSLNGLALVSVGYAFSQRLAAGLKLKYFGLSGSADLTPVGSAAPLASIELEQSTMAVTAGVKYGVNRWLSLGVTTEVFRNTSATFSFDSDINPSGGEEATGGDQSSSTVINPIRIGAGFRPMPRLSVMLDFVYTRAVAQERFSIVDLQTEPLDVYDTLDYHLGAEYNVNDRADLLGGYLYQAPSVGPGGRGANSTTGYGFTDLAEGLGSAPSKPQWLIAAGGRYKFRKRKTKRRRRGKARKASYQMAIEGGGVYGETSIGIGDSGEQPGAYLVQRYRFPIRFTYMF